MAVGCQRLLLVCFAAHFRSVGDLWKCFKRPVFQRAPSYVTFFFLRCCEGEQPERCALRVVTRYSVFVASHRDRTRRHSRGVDGGILRDELVATTISSRPRLESPPDAASASKDSPTTTRPRRTVSLVQRWSPCTHLVCALEVCVQSETGLAFSSKLLHGRWLLGLITDTCHASCCRE